jgi:phage terminase small subunit
MGKVKQPKAIAKIKGTYQPVRYENTVPDSKVSFVNTIPEPPIILTSEKAKEYWYAVLSEASNIYGWIAKVDLALFTNLCVTYGLLCSAQEKVQDCQYNGFVDENDHGTTSVSAVLKSYITLSDQFTKLSKEFGITPSARGSLKLTPQEVKTNDFEELKI